MRKIINVVLLMSVLGSGLISLGGFALSLLVHKHHVQTALKSQRAPGDIKILKFTSREFLALDWENDREFKFEGIMHDVLTVRHDGDSVFVQCLQDDRETFLKEGIEALVGVFVSDTTPQTAHSERSASFIQLIKPVFLEPHTSLFLQSNRFQRSAIPYLPIAYKPPTLDPALKPPRT